MKSYYYLKLLKSLDVCLKYIDEEDKELVSSILNKYKKKVDEINNSTFKIIDPTNKELGSVRGALNNRVTTFYVKDVLEKYTYISEAYYEDDLCKECGKLLENEEYFESYNGECCKNYIEDFRKLEKKLSLFTIFKSDINNVLKCRLKKHKINKDNIDAKILLKRKVGEWWKRTPLQEEASVYILNLMQRDFDNENKEELIVEINKLEVKFKKQLL